MRAFGYDKEWQPILGPSLRMPLRDWRRSVMGLRDVVYSVLDLEKADIFIYTALAALHGK